MLSGFGKVLGGLFESETGQESAKHEVSTACAALLMHCARIDGEHSAQEDERLKSIVMERFELSKADADKVLEAACAQERDAVDIHRFTRVLRDNLDRDGRQEIVRYMWEVADADGTIDADERRMVGLAAQLLDVETHDAVALRQEVLAARGA